MSRLILASTSRYRRELLARLGLPFEARSPGVDESASPGEAPAQLAARLAAAKARSVRLPDAIVIGADQVASLDGVRLPKPGDHATALRQLTAAQGRTVLFHTAVMVVTTATGQSWTHVDLTKVRFARLGTEALDRYLAIDEPYDCAGSFKSEGLGVALFERIDSTDPTALIGLPLIWLASALRAAGLDPLAAPAAVLPEH
jgi:septum formation protein